MHARTTYARLAASICIVATVERRRLWSQPNVRRWIECCSSHSISVRADSTYKANARSSERKSKRRRKKQCWVHKHFDKQKQKKNSISKIKSCQSSWLLFYFRFGFFFSIRNAHGSPIAQSFHFESMALILLQRCRSKSHRSWVSRTLINRTEPRMHCKCLFAVEWYTLEMCRQRAKTQTPRPRKRFFLVLFILVFWVRCEQRLCQNVLRHSMESSTSSHAGWATKRDNKGWRSVDWRRTGWGARQCDAVRLETGPIWAIRLLMFFSFLLSECV